MTSMTIVKMDAAGTCSVCNRPDNITFKLEDAIHRSDSLPFEGANDLEATFRKILKLNGNEHLQSSVCQQCNFEFRRIYCIFHGCKKTGNAFKQLKLFKLQKRKPKDNNQIITETKLANNDESKESIIGHKSDVSQIISPTNILKEELIIDDSAVESISETRRPALTKGFSQIRNLVTCPECTEKFRGVRQLALHRQVHYNGNYPCDQCDEKFQKYNRLLKHRQSHAKRTFDCPKCNAQFIDRRCLFNHMKKKCNKKLDCPECDVKCMGCDDLLRHIKFVHRTRTYCNNRNKIKRKFECEICRKNFLSPIQLGRHRTSHSREVFACKEAGCSAQFNTMASLITHQRIHRKNLFKCNEGGTSFDAKLMSITHCRLIHDEQPEETIEKLKLNETDAGTSDKEQNDSNQKTRTGKAFDCLECGAKYRHAHSLRYHRELHECNKNDPLAIDPAADDDKSDTLYSFVCEQCGMKFRRRHNLKRHKVKHSNKTYDCSECSAKFRYTSNLQDHQKTAHCSSSESNSRRRIPCDRCDAKFRTQYHLKKHQRNFSGSLKSCNKCNAKFCNTHILSYHLQSQHGDKKFQCNECDTKFSIKYHLTMHMRVHPQKK